MADNPEPGQVRLWTYQYIAHGAEAIVYFRWRACTVGTEQYWYEILDHDGIARRRYREIKEIGKELDKLGDIFVDSENKVEVALIKSYDNFWSHRGQPHNTKFSYNQLLESYYSALISNNINTDVTSVDADFSKYKLIIMPAFNLMNEEIGKKCDEFGQRGGALLITFRSGTKTWNNKMTTMTVTGYFKDMSGVELEEFDSINFGRTVDVKGEFGSGTASMWCDVLKTNGAREIAAYNSHYYKGTPAVTVNKYGKGNVYYVACDLDEIAMENLINIIVKSEMILPVLKDKIPGVEAVKREKDGKRYYMILIYNDMSTEVFIDGEYKDLLTGEKVVSKLTLSPYGVVVLQVV